jgi:alkanesulfonate monooxygenase SsuD/methylene tetrahydromethanopterin reductase-like flavin-dependent oxidoreductase (luciferase family)
MKVGIFADLRNPPSWERPRVGLYERHLAAIEYAEALGIGSVWLTEHHLFEDGYLPQPLTFAAAIAARTTRMRIGTGVMIAPLRRPIDIAEQAAVVDLISDGRLELGLGAGYRVPEYEAYGQDIGQRFRLFEACASEVRELWEEGEFTPRPIQAVAPLWIGALGPRGARLAGRLGAGLLSLSRSVLKPYTDALVEAGHAASSARVGGLVNVIVSPDPERAWALLAPHVAYQAKSYSRYGAEGMERWPGREHEEVKVLDEDFDPDTLRKVPPGRRRPGFDVLTPEALVTRLREDFGDLPVDTVFFWHSVAGMPDELVEHHVGGLADVVTPGVS